MSIELRKFAMASGKGTGASLAPPPGGSASCRASSRGPLTPGRCGSVLRVRVHFAWRRSGSKRRLAALPLGQHLFGSADVPQWTFQDPDEAPLDEDDLSALDIVPHLVPPKGLFGCGLSCDDEFVGGSTGARARMYSTLRFPPSRTVG